MTEDCRMSINTLVGSPLSLCHHLASGGTKHLDAACGAGRGTGREQAMPLGIFPFKIAAENGLAPQNCV